MLNRSKHRNATVTQKNHAECFWVSAVAMSHVCGMQKCVMNSKKLYAGCFGVSILVIPHVQKKRDFAGWRKGV